MNESKKYANRQADLIPENKKVSSIYHHLPEYKSVSPLFKLQQTVGNQAVQRLINAGMLQAKLMISQPNDSCEQEADRVADMISNDCHGSIPLAAATSPESSPFGQMHIKRKAEPDLTSYSEKQAPGFAVPMKYRVIYQPGTNSYLDTENGINHTKDEMDRYAKVTQGQIDKYRNVIRILNRKLSELSQCSPLEKSKIYPNDIVAEAFYEYEENSFAITGKVIGGYTQAGDPRANNFCSIVIPSTDDNPFFVFPFWQHERIHQQTCVSELEKAKRTGKNDAEAKVATANKYIEVDFLIEDEIKAYEITVTELQKELDTYNSGSFAPSSGVPMSTPETFSIHRSAGSEQDYRKSGTAYAQEKSLPMVQDILRSPGQPLDVQTRAFFEPRFNYDFCHVRLYTDDKAANSAKALNAQAYTVGSNIVFDRGHYAPGTVQGKQLLAHELTHVVQQGFHAGTGVQTAMRKAIPENDIPTGNNTGTKVPDTLIFLGGVGSALLSASSDIQATNGEMSDLMSGIGWCLLFAVPQAVETGKINRESLMQLTEVWSVKLQVFTMDNSDRSIELLKSAVLKLKTEQVLQLRTITARIIGTNSNNENAIENKKNKKIQENKEAISKVLSQLSSEQLSRLDSVQGYWDKVTGSNTQQLISYAAEYLGKKLDSNLGKLGPTMGMLTKVWVLRNVFTLILDLIRENDKTVSARRMMFLDTEHTIQLYNFLTQDWYKNSKEREISIVSRNGVAWFENKGGNMTQPESGDIVKGLTLENFCILFLFNKDAAVQLSDIVGGYVMKHSPDMGTPRGDEAMRRMDEGVKLIRDVISFSLDIYAVYNPVWNILQTICALINLPEDFIEQSKK